MTVGEKIKKFRQIKGMTQKQLGEKIGNLSQQQIGQWETGKANPKLTTLKRIATALEVDTSDFLDDDYYSIITDEEPGATENEEKFFNEKIIEIINNDGITTEQKKSMLQDHVTQTEISADIHITHAKAANLHLIKHDFMKLNLAGQEKAIEQVELLTKIPEYTKDGVE